MALCTIHWTSSVIGKRTTAQVILPEVGEGPFATFYLLHGLSDDSSNWVRNTRLEHYVRDLPLVVVMPDGYRGFYTNQEEGPAYAKHIGEELPAFIERQFNVKKTREGRAIGGLSMGGYGALRLGLDYADRYCSVNSHSGAVGWGHNQGASSLQAAGEQRGWSAEFIQEIRRIFGVNPVGTPHDIRWLAKRAKAAGNLPQMRLDCGTEDFLLQDNRDLHHDFTVAEVPHSYHEFPGEHNWDYWDLHIREAIDFHAANLGLSASNA